MLVTVWMQCSIIGLDAGVLHYGLLLDLVAFIHNFIKGASAQKCIDVAVCCSRIL